MFVGMFQCQILAGTTVRCNIAHRFDQVLHVVRCQRQRTNAVIMVGLSIKSDQGNRTFIIGIGKLADGVRQGILEVVQTVIGVRGFVDCISIGAVIVIAIIINGTLSTQRTAHAATITLYLPLFRYIIGRSIGIEVFYVRHILFITGPV